VPSLGRVAALPRSVVAVVDRALAFDREARFPDASAMRLALRAVQNELSAIDSRATLPPLSLEPVALSLRTPRPQEGALNKRASITTVRPVAATTTPLPTGAGQSKASALPFFVTLGFAVGIGIVVAARLSVHRSLPAAGAAQAQLAPAAPLPPSPPSAASNASSTFAPAPSVQAPAGESSPRAAKALRKRR
jgi:hypothetical protein